MTQVDYLELQKSGNAMSDNNAKALINNEFGFEFSRIEILTEAGVDITPKGDIYLRLDIFDRPPYYSATDWNYIRFNVNNCYYEMINGELYLYVC